MQTLLISQALWAMERRRPDGAEWPLEQQLQMIRDAGFDGAGVDFADLDYARRVTGLLKANGMIWHAMCNLRSVEALKPIIAHVQELGAEHINLQPNVKPRTLAECIPYLEGWRRLAREAGIRVHIETHRDRMTTDLFFTLDLLDCFPDLRLTGDLFHRILDNCWGFHGRVASREQVQVQISFPHHKDWVDLFRSPRSNLHLTIDLTPLCAAHPQQMVTLLEEAHRSGRGCRSREVAGYVVFGDNFGSE